jgi:hypothetical protein
MSEKIRVYRVEDVLALEASAADSGGNIITHLAEPETTETDQEIMDRLRTRFCILDDMTRAAKAGRIRAMIVTGPPGVGKSHGVEAVLGRHDIMADIAQDERLRKYEFIKGATSALGLYTKLYQFREEKCILVFDDCDSVLLDDLSLNLLKAALDSGSRRQIHWNTDSRLLKDEGIPNSFDFKGSIIFITNIKFDNVRSARLRDHLAAMESRCHYLDLTIDTRREKLLRIRQIVADGMLEKYDFESDEQEQILEFITQNQDQLRELSLRMVLKIADLCASFPSTWRDVAAVTCMRGAA